MFKFNVATLHIDEALENFPETLRRHGFKIIDLREADIVNDYDNSKVTEIYVWQCVGTMRKYLKFKRYGKYEQIIYEGLPTLIGKEES